MLAEAARGTGNGGIAGELSISEATVKRHLANAYEKLGVHTRGQAVAAAARSGLLPAGMPWDGAARFRCAEEGCGCEVAVVRESTDPDRRNVPRCHDREMERVGNPFPATRPGARVGVI